jgi:hypothetical protein
VFAVISSSMFISWQRAVGGRIKSDLRFNKLLSWNTFPLPNLSQAAKAAILTGGEAVREARERQQGVSLADMYPSAGPIADLQDAHEVLDQAVDAAFGFRGGRHLTELDRQTVLFERYVRATTGLLAPTARRRRV